MAAAAPSSRSRSRSEAKSVTTRGCGAASANRSEPDRLVRYTRCSATWDRPSGSPTAASDSTPGIAKAGQFSALRNAQEGGADGRRRRDSSSRGKAVNNVIKHPGRRGTDRESGLRACLIAGAGGRTSGRQVLAEQVSLHHAVTVVESGILGNAPVLASRYRVRTWRLTEPVRQTERAGRRRWRIRRAQPGGWPPAADEAVTRRADRRAGGAARTPSDAW